jgi:hypothetical protein
MVAVVRRSTEQTMMDLYKGRFGDEGIEKFNKVAEKVKSAR